jgi:hypothetical protein
MATKLPAWGRADDGDEAKQMILDVVRAHRRGLF